MNLKSIAYDDRRLVAGCGCLRLSSILPTVTARALARGCQPKAAVARTIRPVIRPAPSFSPVAGYFLE